MEDKNIIKLIGVIAVVIITLILSITGFYVHKDRQIAIAICSGVDPVGASLALSEPGVRCREKSPGEHSK